MLQSIPGVVARSSPSELLVIRSGVILQAAKNAWIAATVFLSVINANTVSAGVCRHSQQSNTISEKSASSLRSRWILIVSFRVSASSIGGILSRVEAICLADIPTTAFLDLNPFSFKKAPNFDCCEAMSSMAVPSGILNSAQRRTRPVSPVLSTSETAIVCS